MNIETGKEGLEICVVIPDPHRLSSELPTYGPIKMPVLLSSPYWREGCEDSQDESWH